MMATETQLPFLLKENEMEFVFQNFGNNEFVNYKR